MADILGLLKIRVKRGINLVVKDTLASDPYVVITIDNQKLKTRVIKENCNPVWNEELTFSIKDLNSKIHLTVYDKDMFTEDDKMGNAEIDIHPYIESLQMGMTNLPNGCSVKKVQPSRTNCLVDESRCVWNDGKITQEMTLRLRNVQSGEVQIEIEWVDAPGCKGLAGSNGLDSF